MRNIKKTVITAVAAGMVAGSLASGAAFAQTVALAADKAGSTFNTVGSALSTVISKHSDLNVILRPYSGPAAWAPMVNNGEVAFGAMSANSAHQAYSGKNESKQAYTDMRVLRSGSGAISVGFLVRKDSGINSYADLKGKRISSDFGGHLSIMNGVNASVEIAGLTWDDVKAVPVAGANDGIEALVNGRLDVTWASLGQPAAREADTQIGVRYLPVPQTKEAEAIYQKRVFPGANLAVAKKGSVPGVVEPTPMLSYDAYFVGHKNLTDKQVRQALEALWKGADELPQYHRSLQGFTNEAAVSSAPVMPYHPAAVKFYKEKGAWTDEAQARQDELLKQAGGR